MRNIDITGVRIFETINEVYIYTNARKNSNRNICSSFNSVKECRADVTVWFD